MLDGLDEKIICLQEARCGSPQVVMEDLRDGFAVTMARPAQIWMAPVFCASADCHSRIEQKLLSNCKLGSESKASMQHSPAFCESWMTCLHIGT